MKLTIGKKLNFFIIFSLLLSIAAVVSISTVSFTNNLVGLLHKDTIDMASIIAGRVRGEMKAVAEQTRIISLASLQDFKVDTAKADFLTNNLSLQKDVFDMALFRVQAPRGFTPYWRQVNPTFQKSKNLNATDFEALDKTNPLPYDSISKGSVEFTVAKLPEGTTVLRVGLPFLQKGSNEFSELLIVDLRSDFLTSLFAESTSYTNFLVDRKGVVIGSSDPSKVLAGATLPSLGISDDMKQGKDAHDFIDPDGEKQIVASQKVGFADLAVISEVPFAIAEKAKQRLIFSGSLLGGAILFLTLALGFIFSQSLTRPIIRLASAAGLIEKGNFNVAILKPGEKVNPKGDEIHHLSHTFDQMVTGLKERDKVKTALSTYHSKELVDKVLSGELQIGGERKEATVLFTDIRSFTTLSESMDPGTLFQLLNQYLGVMVNVILKHGGHIDKFMGDGILAVWGVPDSKAGDTDRAIECCLAMRKALAELNTDFESQGYAAFNIGMGLNHGPVIAGNIGSNERMEYTIIGDTVNTATRIETLTKLIGIDLLISDGVLKNSTGQYKIEDCAGHHVKGKTQTVRVFKVFGQDDSTREFSNVEDILRRVEDEKVIQVDIPDAVEVILAKKQA